MKYANIGMPNQNELRVSSFPFPFPSSMVEGEERDTFPLAPLEVVTPLPAPDMTTTVTKKMDLDTVLASIKNNNIDYVRFEIADQYSVARCKTIPVKHFQEKAKHGHNFGQIGFVGFDPEGGFIPNTGYIAERNFGDAACFPDLDTFAVLPWCKNTARVLLDAYTDGKLEPGFPREVAKTQVRRLKELGYSLFSAHEYEFFVVDKVTQEPAFKWNQWNATSRSSFNLDFTQQIGHDLPIVGVDVETIETEYVPGQMEVTYKPAFGIRAADNAHTYKEAIKEIAYQHNYKARFMTKPQPDAQYSSGAHFESFSMGCRW
ncbi:lengsin-like [Amphiura filiformis]|uniref:lengsin-like n=1 Tax=Amphiura filiformis TaxID=82378 RepID=UPI003B215BE1